MDRNADGLISDCCDARVFFAYDGPVCTQCKKWTTTKELAVPTVEEVIAMPLAEFEQRFGFRPVDAEEKKHFAATGNKAARGWLI